METSDLFFININRFPRNITHGFDQLAPPTSVLDMTLNNLMVRFQ